MSHPTSLISAFDSELFRAGKHFQLYNKLGAHTRTEAGPDTAGTKFAVWAPNARSVCVIGDFNGWNRDAHPMQPRADDSGIWETFVPGAAAGDLYKYSIETRQGGILEKGDPFAQQWQLPPQNATIIRDTRYDWTDGEWMAKRAEEPPLAGAISVYEMHLGSWRRPQDGKGFLSYRELAGVLPGYLNYMGFTHAELMPVMAHPFYGSWGYQLVGYFAPSSRYGTPEDFMFLVDALHGAGIGVILDWVPSHFPTDAHGLGDFDGTHLYEHADPRKGFHPDWKSYIFNYDRPEVRAFLISNALYWLDKFHIDGLRVDAVASMLYLDYSRSHGEWEPNEHGGRENLGAISFLKEFNEAVHRHHPGTFTVAEESTAFPGVTAAVSEGGLGFDMKWMMGWMHDTLNYFQKDPMYRRWHQGQLAFSIHYAFSERFTLPLSHDEVVHGKHSLIDKMPGDDWQKFANLRLLYGYMWGHPGAKLLFMGGEFAQRHEWRHDYSLDWHENTGPLHNGVQLLLRDLNALYRGERALHARDFSPEGFEWIDNGDAQNSVFAWLRKDGSGGSLLFIGNFTPSALLNYRIGAPQRGRYTEVLNSDASEYGGSGQLNRGSLETFPVPAHGRSHSLSLTLPPLGLVVLRCSGADEPWFEQPGALNN